MIPFDSDDFDHVAGGLPPYVDYGPDGEERDEPWRDDAAFKTWLAEHEFQHDVQDFLLHHLPRVSLAMNHGPLLGVQKFMEDNGDQDHQVLKAGFMIVATGPNGDFIVVDIQNGGAGAGRTGWLPMAMIWRMEAPEIRSHFVATNATLGQFLRASEEQWETVPKDWYDARGAAEHDGTRPR